MSKIELREQLIKNGIIDLRKRGCPKVTKENIITNKRFAVFFKSTLEQKRQNAKELAEAIDELIKEIENNGY